jgi:hypothetical protein
MSRHIRFVTFVLGFLMGISACASPATPAPTVTATATPLPTVTPTVPPTYTPTPKPPAEEYALDPSGILTHYNPVTWANEPILIDGQVIKPVGTPVELAETTIVTTLKGQDVVDKVVDLNIGKEIKTGRTLNYLTQTLEVGGQKFWWSPENQAWNEWREPEPNMGEPEEAVMLFNEQNFEITDSKSLYTYVLTKFSKAILWRDFFVSELGGKSISLENLIAHLRDNQLRLSPPSDHTGMPVLQDGGNLSAEFRINPILQEKGMNLRNIYILVLTPKTSPEIWEYYNELKLENGGNSSVISAPMTTYSQLSGMLFTEDGSPVLVIGAENHPPLKDGDIQVNSLLGGADGTLKDFDTRLAFAMLDTYLNVTTGLDASWTEIGQLFVCTAAPGCLNEGRLSAKREALITYPQEVNQPWFKLDNSN